MRKLAAYREITCALIEEAKSIVRFSRARIRRRFIEAQLRYNTARKRSLRR